MLINLNDKLKKVDCVRPREQVDGYALFHTDSARFYVINNIGYQIWQKCNGVKTVKIIIDEIYNSYEKKPEYKVVEQDLIELFTFLLEHKLVLAI